MAWSNPTSRAAGYVVPETVWNQDVVDNPTALRGGAIAITSQAAGDVVIGASATQLGRVANANDATKFLNGAATPAFAQVKDSDLSTSDVTTNNATTAKHGFLLKLSNVSTEFMNGTGAWSAPTDAGLSTSDVTTNNASTSKHGFLKKLSNVATEFMDGTGAWSTPAAPSVGRYSTMFETSARFTSTVYGSGTSPAFGLSGVQLATAPYAGGSSSGIDWITNPTSIDPEPGFGFTVVGLPLDVKGSDGRFFAGIVSSTPSRPGYPAAAATYVARHFGFRIQWDSSGAATLYCTQADGTTNTSTSLATIAENDHLVLQAEINSANTGVIYRHWLNGVAAAETTITANFPSGDNYNVRLAIGVDNNAIASADTATIFGAEIYYGS